MNKGIESIEKILAVGDALCDSITVHRDRGEDWGTWDFVQDVGPDMIGAVGALPDLVPELKDLTTTELIQIVGDLSALVVKAITTVAGGKK